jgi:putative transposase
VVLANPPFGGKERPEVQQNFHIHLVFSTKNREPVISDTVRSPLHAYMATVLQNLGCAPVLINSVEDHAHLLFDLARTVSIS